MSNPYATQIARLEEEVEHLAQRCKAFEDLLASNGEWDQPTPPLTLYQTRLLRILARKDAPAAVVARLMGAYYPDTSCDSIDVIVLRLRRTLPPEIAPRKRRTRNDVLSVPDRAALAEFLATGQLPLRRAA